MYRKHSIDRSRHLYRFVSSREGTYWRQGAFKGHGGYFSLRYVFEVPLGRKFHFPSFCIFVEYDLLTHVTKFQSFTAIGRIFFLAFYSRFHGRHYLALFRKLRLKLPEVTSLAQHEKFHMANVHMDSTS